MPTVHVRSVLARVTSAGLPLVLVACGGGTPAPTDPSTSITSASANPRAFIWPVSEGNSEPKGLTTKQGYHLIHWVEGGMSFWAVSDLNEAELTEFARDFEAGGK